MPDNQQNSTQIPLNVSDEFRQFIEREVLLIIKELAETGNTTQEKLQQMAKLTLDLVKPGMPIDEMYRNAVKLDDQHSELAPVVAKLMKTYEEKYEKSALKEVTELIRNKQYDQAQDMVKKVLEYKISE